MFIDFKQVQMQNKTHGLKAMAFYSHTRISHLLIFVYNTFIARIPYCLPNKVQNIHLQVSTVLHTPQE